MLISVDTTDVRPIYQQIIDEIHRALVTGALRPEDPVPSVRDLASELAINPRTVRQAYGELERDGVIFVKRGLGTFVAPSAKPNKKQRQELVRAVAKRVLLEARRNGVDADELAAMIRKLAAGEEEQ